MIDGDFVKGRLIEDSLAEIGREKDPARKAELLERLGGLYATMEKTLPKALETYQEARKLALERNPGQATELLAKIGIVQLRLGELANCTLYHNRDSCVFPLSSRAVHQDKTGSAAALVAFTEYLKAKPGDAHIEWLAQVAKMTLGDPEAKKWIEKTGFIPESESFPRFPDIASSVGISTDPLGAGGVLVEDFNGDGYLDVVISSTIIEDSLRYFENDGHGHFVDKTKSSHLDRVKNALNLSATDYDNDGRIDIYVNRRNSRALNRKSEVFNSLLRNNGDGTFTDVTKEAGLKGAPNSNVAAAWADYDNDGWLDLFVCNENRGADLFHNEHGHFRQVIGKSGIVNNGVCGGAAWGDVNNDGLQDLFVTNFNGENQLYLNQGGGKFVRSRQPLIETGPRPSYNTWFFDYDNDGWLDLFVATFDQNINHMILDREGKPHPGDHQRLFRNKGDGTFEDVTKQVGLDKSVMAMGGNFGDVDNSGYPSILLGTGGHSLGDIVPNVFFLNQGGKHFADVSVPGGFSSLQDGHAVAFADLDNDGQQDIVMSLGGAYDSSRYFPQLYHNPGFAGSHWITLRLRSTKPHTNMLAIGARVKAVVVEGGKERAVYTTVHKGATFGSNTLQPHLGLGKADRLKTLEILWPGYPEPEIFRDLPMDRFYRTVQGEPKLEELNLRKLQFSETEEPHHHGK